MKVLKGHRTTKVFARTGSFFV